MTEDKPILQQIKELGCLWCLSPELIVTKRGLLITAQCPKCPYKAKLLEREWEDEYLDNENYT